MNPKSSCAVKIQACVFVIEVHYTVGAEGGIRGQTEATGQGGSEP